MAKYCSSCGKEISEGIKFCPSCGKAAVSEASSPVQAQTVQTQPQIKNPGVAAILSFFIAGAGHIYNGQISNGLITLFGVIIASIIAIIYDNTLLLISATLWWIISIYESYTNAQKINRGEIKV